MEAIVQNTVKVAELTNVMKSDLDKTPNRYQILGRALPPGKFSAPKFEIYGKDPDQYYPIVDPNQKPNLPPRGPTSRKPAPYVLDPWPYYTPIPGRILNAPENKKVPIQMQDLTSTFPSPDNIRKMQQELSGIATKQAMEISDSTRRGIYYPDPRPYYDSSLADTKSRVDFLKNSIVNMANEVKNGLKVDHHISLKLEKVNPQYQNQINAQAESEARKQADIYTEVGKDQNNKDVELPIGVSQKSKKPPVKEERGPPVEAEEIQRETVEAEVSEEKKSEKQLRVKTKPKA